MPSLSVSEYALTILLVAAVLHASWNFLLKTAEHKMFVTSWALLVSAACALPIVLVGHIPIDVLPYAFLSAGFEAAYYLTLAYAYGVGDFSVVYPTARGTAPLFLVVWSVLFLGQTPSILGVVGIGLMVIGMITIGNASKKVGDSIRYFNWPFVVALLVAVIISAYTVVDGKASQIANPIPYIALVFVLTALFAFPGLRKLGQNHPISRAETVKIILIGILSVLAYALVVFVYSIAPVVYAGAIREVSVVFGAILGWLLLKEQFGPIRTLGSVLIFAGIILIVLAGATT